ncbi:MAG: hypothetical protein NZO58_13240 [Gemmataceae bacterium]|nr:hypothetical protein [Gemmataceae bacterium]
MSMLSDEDRANLTAYLDGELDEETAQALEAKLSRDPAARAEVEALRQAWAMLDYLPRATPSATFTHRTLEKLSLAHRPVETGKMPRSATATWRVRLAWAACLLAAGAGGWLAGDLVGRPTPDPDEALIRYLPLIEKWRAYELVDNIDFLKALDHRDWFGQDASY